MTAVQKESGRDALASLRISREELHHGPSAAGRLFRFVLMLGVLGGIGAGGYYLAQKNGLMASSAEWVPEAIRSRTEVRVGNVAVETGRAADAVVVATGYLESFRQAKIGARGAGRIDTVLVEEGSKVTEGEVLAVLDHKDIEAALAAAKASLQQAEAQLGEQDVEIARAQRHLERNSKLRKLNSLSESDYDTFYFQHQAAVAKRASMEAAIALAKARVMEAEQFKENMIVRAPFNGTVISKDAEVGESILPGGMGEASGRGSVVTIADLDRLEVDCDVKEDYISRVRNGSPAEVVVDAVPNRRYVGKVRKVIPMGDRARATIKVKVSIVDADEKLFPDMSATVYFLPEPGEKPVETKERRIFCPNDAIQTGPDGSFVWTVDPNLNVASTPITTGPVRDNRTEILEGLKGGERVVLSPPKELHVGERVKLRD